VNVRLCSDVDTRKPFYGSQNKIFSQLEYLNHNLESGARDMQNIFPEGAFFLYALYGLSWVETALALPGNADVRKEALVESKRALKLFVNDRAVRIFDSVDSPPRGAFYSGWSNYLRAKILLLEKNSASSDKLVQDYVDQCREIKKALEMQASPFLASYSGGVWPADGLVAVASLNLYKEILDSSYVDVVDQYMSKVKNRLSLKYGLIAHSVDAVTGNLKEEPRGASQVLMLRLLAEIDTEFALSQYLQFRANFVTTWLGLPAVREYPKDTFGLGDIDSGPVIFGVGAAASVVSIATFQAYGDSLLANRMNLVMEALSISYTWNGKRGYTLGLLEVGDAFLCWARTTPNYILSNSLRSEEYESPWWRLKFQMSSLLLVGLLFSPKLYRLIRRKFR